MKLLSFLLALSVIIFSLSSCTNQKAESTLLSDKTSCSLEDCPEPQKKVDGSLSIQADQGAYQLNVDKSDVIEIAGKCSDLGVRNNRILVEMYEGEDVSLPNALFFENSSSVNCVNSSTPSLNNRQCFWVTQGRSVIDSGAVYPQCFNGRFSFSVKVGRILRTTETGANAVTDEALNPRRKYLVRFKLRANDGAISESGWASTLIDRGVSKPTFGQDSLPWESFKCDIKINAFKNLERLTDIFYTYDYTQEFVNQVNGGTVGLIPIPYTEPITANPLAHVTNHRISNVIPGVKYKVKVKAFDNKYSYALQNSLGMTMEESLFSEELYCGYQRPNLSLSNKMDNVLGTTYTGPIVSTCANSLKVCTFDLPFPVLVSGSLEWMIIKGKSSWSENFEPSGVLPTCGCIRGTPACPTNVEGCTLVTSPTTLSLVFKPESYPKNTCTGNGVGTNSYNGSYGVSVRYVNALGQKGAWSPVVPSINDCVFSN